MSSATAPAAPADAGAGAPMAEDRKALAASHATGAVAAGPHPLIKTVGKTVGWARAPPVVIVTSGAASPGGRSLSPTTSNASSDAASAATNGDEAVLVVPAVLPAAKRGAEPGEIQAAAPPPPSPEPAAQAAAAATAAAVVDLAPRSLPRLYLSHEHPAVLVAQAGALRAPPPRGGARALRDYVLMPLALPLLAAYWAAALAAALAAAFLIWPSLLLAQRLYWACPFIPRIFEGPMRAKYGALASWLMRLQFEGAHCVTVVGRLLTLPLRPHLPDFYIAGFPKCGTTSLAAYLKLHPALSGIAGMPGHEALSKESHFFGGLLGHGSASSAALYRSCFPTIITRWWREAVLGAGRWQCFDATPTYACLPHVPARVKALTPGAKVVFMVREPTAAVFSAECMLRGMGVPLEWSMARRPQDGGGCGGGGYVDVEAGVRESGAGDALMRDDASHDALWDALAGLPPGEALPEGLPGRFYFEARSYVRSAQYADRLEEWARHLPAENMMVVDFKRFVETPEVVVREVLAFVGADGRRYAFRRLPPGMATDYRGAKMHPAVRRAVGLRWFTRSNAELAEMLGHDMGWTAAIGAKH